MHYGAIKRIIIHRQKDVARVAELRRMREEAGRRDAETKEWLIVSRRSPRRAA